MRDDVASAEPQALRCASHPQVETYLRCGRCDTPICPRCLIQTPVGARCKSCAQMRRLPMYDVGPGYLVRGGLAGLASAFAVGVVIQIAPNFGFFMQLILGGCLGYAVAGAVSLATNRKRGSSLGWTTVVALFVGFLLSRSALAYLHLGVLEPGARLGRALAVGLSPDLGSIVLLLVAALVAFTRLR